MADETSPTVMDKETRVASVSLRSAPAVGEKIGKYVIERTIGSGGMGTVVAARHEQIGEVAIKILHPKGARDKIQVERFLREARAIAKIKSEHVVRVLDAGQEEGGCPYIVMELLQGEDIAHVLKNEGRLAPDVAVDVMLQVCEAVASMHAQGIIHRDLKPSNFFLTRGPDGAAHVKVLDFGISKAIEADPATDPKLTETQAVFGSPTYMSPEQIRSAKHVDARSDVWSLGVSMFEMLTTKVPFVADNVPGILASIVADEPFRVGAFVEGVPEELEAIVLTCLEKDPARRISSPAELAQHLAAFASDEGKVLVERIDRIARGVATGPQGSLASRPPPRLARPSTPPPLSSARGLSSGAVPLPAPSHPSVPAPVAIGTTDADLRAMRAPASRRNVVAVALAVVGVVAVIAAVAIVVATKSPTKTADAVPAASPPPPASTAGAVTAEPAATLTASASASAVAATPPRRRPGRAAPSASSRPTNAPPNPNGELSDTRH